MPAHPSSPFAGYRAPNRLPRLLTGALIAAGCVCLAPALTMFGATLVDRGALSLAIYAEVFGAAGRLARLTVNSVVIAAGSAAVALALGGPCGFLCFRTDVPGRRLAVLTAMLAACMPLYVPAAAWVAIVGLPTFTASIAGVCWIQGAAAAPLAMLIVGITASLAPAESEELALLDTDRAGVIRHVTVPQSINGMFAAAAIVAVLTLGDITVTDLLMVRSFAEETFTQFQLGASPGRAAAVSVPLVLLLAGIVGAALRGRPALLARNVRTVPTILLGRWRPAAALPVAVAALCYGAIPLLALLRAVEHPVNLWSAARATAPEIAHTLLLAPVAASATTAIAAPAAWLFVRYRHSRGPIIAAAAILLAVPGPVQAAGIAALCNRPGILGSLYDSPAVLVYAYVLRALPFALLAIIPVVMTVPRELEDAAALDGAGPMQTIWRIVAPLSRRGITAAWCLAFVLAVGELGASVLIVPAGTPTLTIRFYSLLHYGVYPAVAGMCIILTAIVAAPAAILTRLLLPVTIPRATPR